MDASAARTGLELNGRLLRLQPQSALDRRPPALASYSQSRNPGPSSGVAACRARKSVLRRPCMGNNCHEGVVASVSFCR